MRRPQHLDTHFVALGTDANAAGWLPSGHLQVGCGRDSVRARGRRGRLRLCQDNDVPPTVGRVSWRVCSSVCLPLCLSVCSARLVCLSSDCGWLATVLPDTLFGCCRRSVKQHQANPCDRRWRKRPKERPRWLARCCGPSGCCSCCSCCCPPPEKREHRPGARRRRRRPKQGGPPPEEGGATVGQQNGSEGVRQRTGTMLPATASELTVTDSTTSKLERHDTGSGAGVGTL